MMMMAFRHFCFLLFFARSIVVGAHDEKGDDVVLAGGCFWCMEQTFEQHVPGVIGDVISGYSGGSMVDPTYRNHGNHIETIKVTYDPSKATYVTMLAFFFRNIDPLNGRGQFCDTGHSYIPAIFYGDENEKKLAEEYVAKIESDHPSWGKVKVAVLPRAIFYEAEDYHQDYYVKNPRRYHYYKTGCGRVERLKNVWGTKEYEKYHSQATGKDILEETGASDDAKTNEKNTPEVDTRLPDFVRVPIIVGSICIAATTAFVLHRRYNHQHQHNCDEKKTDGELKQKTVALS